MPESGQGKRHRREPEAFPRAPEKAPSREHDGRGGHVNGDVVDRVARLGEAVGGRWIRVESGANHAGELGVDVGLEVNDVPDCGSVARASTSQGQIRMRDPCAGFDMIPRAPHRISSLAGLPRSGGPVLGCALYHEGRVLRRLPSRPGPCRNEHRAEPAGAGGARGRGEQPGGGRGSTRESASRISIESIPH